MHQGELQQKTNDKLKEIEEKQMPLDQKALMKKFGFDHGYIKKLERRGLAFRKQGKKKMYDVRDVYEILEKENFLKMNRKKIIIIGLKKKRGSLFYTK